MRANGRPVLGFFAGLFFGLFLAIDLLVFGLMDVGSSWVTIFPAVFAFVGVALAFWGPLPGRSRPEPGPEPSLPIIDETGAD